MIKINESNLESGLLVTGINPHSTEARLIRKGVHSVTNHNAMTVHTQKGWHFAEAVPPASTLSSIAHYEKLINNGYRVRFYKLKTLTRDQQTFSANYFAANLLNLSYPRKWKMLLLILPVYNAIVDRSNYVPSIRLTWCSQLCKRAFEASDRNCLLRYDGHRTKLFTPKTFENRIIEGIFQDITDTILVDDTIRRPDEFT